MDGQLTITDYLKSQIELRRVMDLTSWINTQGKAQYGQVKDIVKEYVENDVVQDSLTNRISVYILEMSLGYMEYLRKEAGCDK